MPNDLPSADIPTPGPQEDRWEDFAKLNPARFVHLEPAPTEIVTEVRVEFPEHVLAALVAQHLGLGSGWRMVSAQPVATGIDFILERTRR